MFEFRTSYSKYENCKLDVNKYMVDDSVCIEIYNDEEGCIARITTCLNSPFLSENQGYVDTNNCPWAVDLIERLHLGTPSGITSRSGYCEYPLYDFNMDELNKHTEI